MGLDVLDAREADAHGVARVLFAAKVFHKGKDLSFVELSEFLHDGTGWRYLRGDALPVARIGDRTTLTIDLFFSLISHS
jgi:SEC-C motif-containing protein